MSRRAQQNEDTRSSFSTAGGRAILQCSIWLRFPLIPPRAARHFLRNGDLEHRQIIDGRAPQPPLPERRRDKRAEVSRADQLDNQFGVEDSG